MENGIGNQYFYYIYLEIRRLGEGMTDLTREEMELIEAAREAIRLNYDAVAYHHTVGAAVRCKNGNVYRGVNVYSMHGACAEQIAIGAAITAGEREFETIVAAETAGRFCATICRNAG